ncbi:MAG: type III pantothenate kinase [Candidatus Omnitrophota bacterium]
MTVLLIDIGNTNTAIAFLKGNSIKKRYFISTSKKRVRPRSLARLLGKRRKDIEEVLIVSVVPDFYDILTASLKKVIPGARIRTVGKEVKVPMKVDYDSPAQVGQDRLVTAFSAYRLRKGPVLVIDFGTAVTFDIVLSAGVYEGGLIFPGIRLGLSALTENTALLPKTALKTVQQGLFGKNTRDSMNLGIILGYAALCDGIIDRFREAYGAKLKIVITGGDAALVERHSRCILKKDIQPDLIFRGLKLLSEL